MSSGVSIILILFWLSLSSCSAVLFSTTKSLEVRLECYIIPLPDEAGASVLEWWPCGCECPLVLEMEGFSFLKAERSMVMVELLMTLESN
jgi:hypothetical protein